MIAKVYSTDLNFRHMRGFSSAPRSISLTVRCFISFLLYLSFLSCLDICNAWVLALQNWDDTSTKELN